MTRRYKNSFRDKALKCINAMQQDVFLRRQLTEKLNAQDKPRQITRALKALVEDGLLENLCKGVYVRTKPSKYSDKPILRISFQEACILALKLLNVSWEAGTAIQDYNAGRTQQVPVKMIIKLKSRFRGSIGNGQRKIIFENKTNAR